MVWTKKICRLQGKAKQKLLQHFDDELLFVTVSNNEAQVVMSKQVLSNTKQCSFLRQNKSFVLKEAAKVIRDDVVTMIQQAPILTWSPTVESMESQERQLP